MSGPYREVEPSLLLCPRCGELLVAVLEEVSACARCSGTWIPQPIVDRAFGDPAWPHGANAWWRRELECPECAGGGAPSVMLAVAAGNIVVDRCAGHGLWIDAGELRRLLDHRTGSDLDALHAKLAPGAPPPADLATWRTSIDERQREAQLAAYHARRTAMIEAREARDRAEREGDRAEVERLVRAQEEWERTKHEREDERRVAADQRRAADEERAREAARASEQLRAANQRAYDNSIAEVGRLEGELVRVRTELREVERALTDERGRAAGLRERLDGR